MPETAATASLIESFKKPVPSHPSKRNNACRQCRKRKLKCDGRRPCSTCLRSHAYLVNHPLPGVPPPPEYPECIYDNGTDEVNDDEKPEGYRKLENRISELESLLRDMSMELQASNAALNKTRPPSMVSSDSTRNGSQYSSPHTPADSPYTSQPTPPSDTSSQRNSHSPEISAPSQFSFEYTQEDLSWCLSPPPSAFPPLANSTSHNPSQTATGFNQPFGSVVSHSADLAANIFDGIDATAIFDSTFLGESSSNSQAASHATSLDTMVNTTNPVYDFQERTVVQTGWSPHLPDPATTRRLAEAFFAFHIHAGRLFHGPSFLASLDLHPLDERFPSVAVLHALCAVGSMFSSEIAPTPIHTHSSFPYVVFHGRWRRLAARPDSFAEQHAKLAHIAVSQLLESGEHIVMTLQAQILLSWFYISQARWSEAFMNSGSAIRNCIPLGLTTCKPFKIPSHGLEDGPIVQEPNILPESDSPIEEETRRNIFWLAYALERQCSISSAFSVELDDHDINQLLPVRGDQFELGKRVPIECRQFSNDKDVLINHPPQQIDSFILFTKSAMLLSRVKAFNTRYKARFHNGDPALYPSSNALPTSLEEFDPRDTPAFREVDQLVTDWRKSIPANMRQPVQDGIVDPHLYAALIVGHLVVILLHDPHMNTNNPMCPSAAKVLNAARGILESLYLISSTSYDISLLDQWCHLTWYMAGRALIRFLNAAIRHNYMDHVIVLHTEITYVHEMLGKAGERVPAAYRSKRLLFDILVQTCGEQFADPPSSSSVLAYISPAESTLVDRGPSKNLFGSFSSPPAGPGMQY